MSAENPAATREPDGLSRYFIGIPALAGVVLLTAAVVWTLNSDDVGLFGFLLMIFGGWSLAFAFVNVTMEMRSTRLGVLVHLGVAAVITAVALVLIESKGAVLDGLSEPVRAVVVVLQIAAGPAAAWIWLGLLSRIADRSLRRSATRRRALVTPEWEREQIGDGSGVRFAAIGIRLRTLTLAIIGIVIAGGALSVALLIALDNVGMQLGPRVAVVLMGLVIGVPGYLLLVSILRRHTLDCTVAFGDDELRIRTDEVTRVIPFRDLEFLLWRSRSEYARVEIRGGGVDLSLMSGLAKPAAGMTAELPPLPRRVFRRLEIHGLATTKGRRDEVVTFRRPVAADGET